MSEIAAPPRLPLRDRRRPSAPVPLTRRLSPSRYYRALRTNPIATWHQDAFEMPILVYRGPLGDMVVVNAPDAIRRLFLDNVGNYPPCGRPIGERGTRSGRPQGPPLHCRRCWRGLSIPFSIADASAYSHHAAYVFVAYGRSTYAM